MNDGPTPRTEAEIIEHLAMSWVDLVGPIHLNNVTAALGSVADGKWADGYTMLDSAQRYRLACRVVEILNGLARAEAMVDDPVRKTQEDRNP